jgi:hypothetical protein
MQMEMIMPLRMSSRIMARRLEAEAIGIYTRHDAAPHHGFTNAIS